MAYLDPTKLRAARLSECEGLSLLLAHTARDEDFLIVGSEKPRAIFIEDGEWAWHNMSVANQDMRSGLVIADVRLEVDLDSRFDADNEELAGALVRRGGRLSIWSTHGNRPGFAGGYRLDVSSDLTDSTGVSVGFSKWRIVKGEGKEAETLVEFDVKSYRLGTK